MNKKQKKNENIVKYTNIFIIDFKLYNVKIDQKDQIILTLLEQNSRASIQLLSKATGMPASTVHHRVKKLEKEGVIKKYTIELDEDKVGRGFTVYMMVTGRSDNYLGEDFFRKSEVAEVSAITGNFDLLIKLQFSDMEHFDKFLMKFRERYGSNIDRTVSMVRIAKLK